MYLSCRGRSCLFPVDGSPFPLLSSIMSQVDPRRHHDKNFGHQVIALALEAGHLAVNIVI